MPSSADRRLVILAEGNFGFHHGKTAMGVIRFGTDKVLAVIDSTQAGRNVREWLGDSGRYDIPIVATLSDALGFLPRANGLLIGIAPTGGKLPDSWRQLILAAIRSGLDIHSGLHTFLGDDPEFAEAARSAGVRLIDYRRPPERMETAVGRRHAPGKRVILTVGTDCAIGKMSVALELRRAAAGGRPVHVVRGDRPDRDDDRGLGRRRRPGHRDFVQGTCEWLVEEGERRGDWVIVEGQGTLDHPAYSSVTLGLIHGTTPHAMVLVHKPGMADHDFDHLPGRPLPDREAAAVHRAPRAIAGSSRRRRSSRSRSTRRSSTTRRRRAGSSPRRRPRPGSRATTRSGSAATRCGARSRPRSTACRG